MPRAPSLHSFTPTRKFCSLSQPEHVARARTMARDIRAGSRMALAKAITLVESTRYDHRQFAEALISSLHEPLSASKSFRVGISGPPGAGKSTFIESLGVNLCEKNEKVAVLAVDPSSVRTGGSLLGDKTRMTELSRHPNAYVRPSPTRGTLGGVTRHTTEAIAIVEAAGYNTVLVETVGVGQSETAVEEMVDLFLLLAPPVGGDELQGIKKGIVELADLIAVNKADGDFAIPARRAAAEFRNALKFIRPKSDNWEPKVLTCSAATNTGVNEVWQTALEFRQRMKDTGEFERKRGEQRRAWMWKMVQEELMDRFLQSSHIRTLLPQLESAVTAGKISASVAADRLLREFSHEMKQASQ